MEEELEMNRGRGLLRNHSPSVQVGFMKTGIIVALEVNHYSNAGNTMDLSDGVSRPTFCIWGDREVKGEPHSLFTLADTSLLISLHLQVLHLWFISKAQR